MIQGLPEKLKMLRLKYGLSQKQVANRLGLSPSIVSGYETGERTPSIGVLLALSFLYQCSTDYLLNRNDNTQSYSINLEGLTDEQIKAIRMLIDSMAQQK